MKICNKKCAVTKHFFSSYCKVYSRNAQHIISEYANKRKTISSRCFKYPAKNDRQKSKISMLEYVRSVKICRCVPNNTKNM